MQLKNQKKFSGNAQKRARHFILHHGTILYDFELSLIDRYLLYPKDVPAYRADRDHHNFLANIPLKDIDIKRALKKEFQGKNIVMTLSEEEQNRFGRFLLERQGVCV